MPFLSTWKVCFSPAKTSDEYFQVCKLYRTRNTEAFSTRSTSIQAEDIFEMVLGKPRLTLGKTGNGAKPIAIVRGGTHDGEFVFLHDGTNESASASASDANDANEIGEKDLAMIDKIVNEMVAKFATDKKMQERVKRIRKLQRMIRNGMRPKDPILQEIYDAVMAKYATTSDQEIELKTGSLEMLPEFESERECCYIAAPSGSGKSYLCRAYAKNYNRIFPKNKVILFSKEIDDPSLDGIKNVTQIPLDETLLDNPIEMDDLDDTLCIFDDVDTIRDSEVMSEVNHLKDDILETGRHHNTHCLITSHLLTAYSKTRTVLNESHRICVYPHSGSAQPIRYTLKTYVGLDNADIRKILKLRTRWCCVSKSYPQYVLHEGGCYLIASDD